MARRSTDDSELRDAAGTSCGAGRAAGSGSHGRLRGCPVPLLGVLRLQDGDGVDSRAVRFPLELRKKEQEEAREKEAREEEEQQEKEEA